VRDDRSRLRDILEAIGRIEVYASRGRDTFDRDELVQTWIVHHLQIIGEAVGRLTETFLSAHPEIPWSQIIGMRNILVHDYFRVDAEQIWSTVERDLPRLKEEIKAVLGSQMNP